MDRDIIGVNSKQLQNAEGSKNLTDASYCLLLKRNTGGVHKSNRGKAPSAPPTDCIANFQNDPERVVYYL